MKPFDVELHSSVHDKEDVVMTNVKSLIELINSIKQKPKCSRCNKNLHKIVIERTSGQYKLNFICIECGLSSCGNTWINSPDWTSPGPIRKFVESMTMSGVNYWQYKRYLLYLY